MADKEINELENDAVVETEEVEEAASSNETTKDTKTEKKEKKPGFFSRLGSKISKFFKTMKSELKKVTWFSRKQTFTSTLLVLVVMVAAGVVLGVLDLGFGKGLDALTNLF